MNDKNPSLLFKDGKWELNRPYLMGVINFTDDSFYPHSRLNDHGEFARRLEEIAPFMDILDIGAESTRPGAEPVDAQTELSRLLPKLKYVKNRYPHLKVSVDTYKAETARECISLGADLINDVSAGEFSNNEIFGVCSRNNIPMVLMHKQGVPKTMQEEANYQDVVIEVFEYLQNRVKQAIIYGMTLNKILIDVGIGFGKKIDHNLDLLRNLPKFKEIGTGILVGASRKTLLGEITGQPVENRLAGSIAIHLAALSHCHIVRCHDVREMHDALKVFFSIIDYKK